MQRVRSPDGRIRYTYASPGMRDTFGLDPGTIVGQDPATHDWVHIEDRQRFLDALERSAETLATLDEELRVVADDGHVKWVRSIGYPRRLRDGTVVWDGIAMDVTERHEAAAMLERALQLARETEETRARLLTGGAFRRQLSDIKEMIEELATRTAEPTAAAIVSTLRQAVIGILLKIDARDDIAPAATDQARLEPAPASAQHATLSPRQQDVLRLVGDGLSNREIAQKLEITEGTAKLHVAAILKRLGVRNRTAAIRAAR